MRVPVRSFRLLGVAAGLLVLAACSSTYRIVGEIEGYRGILEGGGEAKNQGFDKFRIVSDDGSIDCSGSSSRLNQSIPFIIVKSHGRISMTCSDGRRSLDGRWYQDSDKSGRGWGQLNGDRYNFRYSSDTEELAAHKVTLLAAKRKMNSDGQPKKIPTASELISLCTSALQINHPRWKKNSPSSRPDVQEAKRRGLNQQQCSRLSGRFTEQQIAAVHQLPHQSKVALSNVSRRIVCFGAIQSDRPRWDYSYPYDKLVLEAKRRGLSEQQCARLARRYTEQQIAAANAPPIPNRRKPPIVRPTRKPAAVAKATPKKPKTKAPVQSNSGSGFFVSKLGHVVTNAHVVNGCKRVTVGDSANSQAPAALISADKRNDLALLKLGSLETASAGTKSLLQNLGLKVVPLAADGLLRFEDVELGENVLVAGFPFGEIFGDTIKVTRGIVSAVRGIGNNSGQFQTDAAAQSGNSGGPIYDENGNIVGVVVAQLNKLKVAKAIGSLPENVNFGIKTSAVRQFLNSSGLPSKWSTRSKKMSNQELAKIAQKQTLMVMCYR